MDPPPADSTPLGELTRRMVQGDNAAWHEFHRVFGPRMFRHLLACTRGDHALAGDALQGAYLRIARHVRACEDETQWTAWLLRVARTELSDLRRRDARFLGMLRRWFAEPQWEADAPDCFVFAMLDASLAELEEDTRALLDAKYLRGQRIDQIAETLGVSIKSVESRLTRARAKLRQLLEERLHKNQS